jgi:hypothetical protein
MVIKYGMKYVHGMGSNSAFQRAAAAACRLASKVL